MRLPRFRSFVWIGAVLGTLGPLFYYVWPRFRDYVLSDGIYFWPAGLINMLSYGHEHDFSGHVILAASIVANILVYAAAAALIWLLLWVVLRVFGGNRS